MDFVTTEPLPTMAALLVALAVAAAGCGKASQAPRLETSSRVATDGPSGLCGRAGLPVAKAPVSGLGTLAGCAPDSPDCGAAADDKVQQRCLAGVTAPPGARRLLLTIGVTAPEAVSCRLATRRDGEAATLSLRPRTAGSRIVALPEHAEIALGCSAEVIIAGDFAPAGG